MTAMKFTRLCLIFSGRVIGAFVPRDTTTRVLVGAFATFGLVACVNSVMKSDEVIPAARHTEPAAKKHTPPTDAELAAVGVFGKTLDGLRDPQSLQLIEVLAGRVSEKGKDEMVGCMSFRARNGFGGMNIGYSTWVMNSKGALRFAIDNVSLWNKHCANMDLEDKTSLIASLAKARGHLR